RRRHTRCYRDWSSDVCSSDLAVPLPLAAQGYPSTFVAVRSRWPFEFAALRAGSTWNYQDAFLLQPTAGDPLAALLDIADRVTDEIGRASCRARVWTWVVARAA